MPAPTQEFYEKYWAPGQAWSPSEGYFEDYERKLVLESATGGKICLDYGCGDGRRYGWFLRQLGLQYHGYDISTTAVQAAGNLGLAASLLDPNGRTSLEANSCDFAICFEVFEHLLEPQNALTEIFRVLRPGGRLLCSVPNVAYLPRRIEFLFTGFLNPKGDPRTERTEPWCDPHLRFFSSAILRRFLLAGNFEVLQMTGSPFTLDFLIRYIPFVQASERLELFVRRILNGASFLGSHHPGLFARRLLAVARKPEGKGGQDAFGRVNG